MSEQERTPRDNPNGNWMDNMGCCRVCDGEIPYGHTKDCDVYKLEHQNAELKKRVEKLEEVVRMLQAPDVHDPEVLGRRDIETIDDVRKLLLQSQAREGQLREAAKALVNRMKEIYEHEQYQSVWALYKIHGGDYTNGPTWVKEFESLEQALSKSPPPPVVPQ